LEFDLFGEDVENVAQKGMSLSCKGRKCWKHFKAENIFPDMNTAVGFTKAYNTVIDFTRKRWISYRANYIPLEK